MRVTSTSYEIWARIFSRCKHHLTSFICRGSPEVLFCNKQNWESLALAVIDIDKSKSYCQRIQRKVCTFWKWFYRIFVHFMYDHFFSSLHIPTRWPNVHSVSVEHNYERIFHRYIYCYTRHTIRSLSPYQLCDPQCVCALTACEAITSN